MEISEIIEHLRVSLSVVLDREVESLPVETRILTELELDSIRFVELLMSLEDTIGLEVDPESLEPEVFETVGSFAEYVQGRLALAETSDTAA